MSLEELKGFATSVALARSDAMFAWREQYAKRVLFGDLFAESVTSVTTEVTNWPKGRMTVIVTVRGRRQHQDETYLFRFVRQSNGGYRRTGSSLPSS